MSYFPGQLVSIHMENFMTFDDTEIKFHPNINLIIGPNGTGKSSIVSAICLGLGGNATTLGKHGNLAQFIKHGKAFARLTTKLSSSNISEDFVTIQLTIDLLNASKQTTKLEWKLNKRVVSSAIIREKLQDYNINVNNLCQFLAQDRVIQLSKLNKFQLLREFEETISHRNHINFTELHNKVVNEQTAIKYEQSNFKSVLKEIDFALKNKELYESDYLNLEKEKNLNIEIDKTDYIINLAYLCLYKKQLKNLDSLHTNQKSNLQEYQIKQSGFSSQIKAHEKQLSKLTQTNSSLADQLKKIQTKFKQADTRYDKKEDELDSICLNKENLITNLISTRNSINELNATKEDYELFISENKENADFEYIKNIIKDNRSRIIKLDKIRILLENEQSNLENSYRNTESLIKVENSKLDYYIKRLKNKKLASVFCYNYRQKVHNLIGRLRADNMFKGKVYGPLISDISTQNSLVSLMVETAISNNIKFVYICNKIQDVTLINRKAEEMNLRISTILQEQIKTMPKRIGDLEYLKRNSVDGYLDQFIECNDLIRSVLIDHCNIHNIAVSFTEPTLANMVNILPSTNSNINTSNSKKCKILYTKSKTFYTKTSFYNSSKVSINSGYYFHKICYLFDHKEEINNIKRQHKSIYENLNNFENKLNSLKKDMEILKQKIHLNQNKIEKIKTENDEYENKIKELIDKEKELEEIESTLNTNHKYFKESIKTLSANNNTSIDTLNSYYNSISNLQTTQEYILQEDIFVNSLKALQKQVLKEEVDRLKSEKFKLEEEHQNELATIKEYKDRKKEFNDQIRHYNKIIKNHKYLKSNYNKKNKDGVDNAMENIHLNPEDVDTYYIKDMEEKLLVLENKNKYINYNVDNIKNYTKASNRINELNKVKEQKENYLNERKYKFEYEAGNYIKELKTMVQNLDNNFSKLFKDITNSNGSGNVLLRELEDYSKLSLEILIRFRKNEQMKTLKHTLQSGGEKSLVTMVFLLSLQSMNSSPFRLVDEINQGMDAYNERKLMDTVKEKIGKTQYFIITPKLLSGFTFSENVKVHFVVNGPYIANKEVLDVIHQASKKVEVKETNKNYYDPKKDKSVKPTNSNNKIMERDLADDLEESSTDDFLSESDVEDFNNNRNITPTKRRAYRNINEYSEDELEDNGIGKLKGIMGFIKTKRKVNTINRINRLFNRIDDRTQPNRKKKTKVVKSESDIEIESEEFEEQRISNIINRNNNESEIEFSLSD